MTPHDFIRKWRNAELKERSASQSHFNDLCALLGLLDPVSADPTGEWFTFEKGATKTGGGNGWADAWRKGCFAWEYKGRHANLDKALSQLLQYQAALENPPLLIVSDMDRIIVRTNFTNTVQERHDFDLEDLRDGDTRERLKRAFTDPDSFKPSKTRTALTEETAREFAGLAQRLRDRGHDPGKVAHFVNQLVFCMFAEDSALLPDDMFTDMLQLCRFEWDSFPDHAGTLFAAMAEKGGKVGFKRVEWFNGGLFDGAEPLPLTEDDVEELARAAKRDWSQIDPSILGTLFERGLDPAKRSQLGAHYTDRAKIDLIVRPVIVEPLEAEWAEAWNIAAEKISRVEAKAEQALAKAVGRTELADEVKALRDSLKDDRQYALFETLSRQKRVRELDSVRSDLREASRAVQTAQASARQTRDEFLAKLKNFRVLDPACGSGNFLYVALNTLKDIEHRVNLEAEQAGIGRSTPMVGPECVLGIELNPYAAELARVSVWIGEIQWMRRNGFDVAKNPILRPLETIECRDAVLNADGTRAEWPSADAIIGNPPFLGSKYLRKGRPATKTKPALEGLGDDYVDALFDAYKGAVPASADLVSYWFYNVRQAIDTGSLFTSGLIATKSIGKGASNRPLASILSDTDFGVFNAWRNEAWVVNGADVRVAIVCLKQNPATFQLDGTASGFINTDLTSGIDLSKASQLQQNRRRVFQGVKLNGPFEIDREIARSMLLQPMNPNNEHNHRVVRRFFGNDDVSMRDADEWVIDFTDLPNGSHAALFEAPYAHVRDAVSAHRAGLSTGKSTETERLSSFWLMQRPRPKLRAAIAGLAQVIAVPETSEHLIFRFLPSEAVFSGSLFVIAAQDTTKLGILSSRIHGVWAKGIGNRLGAGNQSRYNATRTYQTFPFPEGLTPDIPAADYADDPRAQAIAAAAATLNELRENWLNPADLIVREPEVVPGYPDRILPKDEDAAKELKKRTLTNLYNARPQWLANAHATLDAAVADAYGWGAEWAAGGMTDDDILSRLFALNQQRAGTGG